MALRKYQSDALQAVSEHHKKGVRRQLAALATGTGKTVIFSNLPTTLGSDLPGQMLVLAHREELIKQAADKIQTWNPGLSVGVEMADIYAGVSDDVIVSSVATIGRKGTKRVDRFDWTNITKIVCDEAHHSLGTTYINIFELAGVMNPETTKLLLGVTATPNRGDGQGLAKVYDKIVYTYTIRQAIEDGWLVDVKGIKVRTNTSLDEVRTVAGDFNNGELAHTVNNPKRNQLIVKAWKDNALNRPTIAFTADIRHAKDLAAMFQKYGVAAEAVWGDDPDRAKKLAMHRAGEITVLCNCGVLTEGYDDWRVSCVILARPTKSQGLFTQMCGRGTRLEEGTGNLLDAIRMGKLLKKTDCIIIDVVDNSDRHSLVTLPSLMGMNAKMDLRGGSVVGAVKKLEAAQQEHPNVDFSTLEDINNIQAHVEAVNFWDIKFPPEVEQNSELSWHRAMDGSFVLLLPQKERVTIKQNMLDKWDIDAQIAGQKYHGERDSVEKAFNAADELLRTKAHDAMKILKREAEWHDGPMTPGQSGFLRKLLKGRYAMLPEGLTKGQASKIISNTIAGKIKGTEART